MSIYEPLIESLRFISRNSEEQFATDVWDESKHPRGNENNAGQFAKKGSGSEAGAAGRNASKRKVIERGKASLFGAESTWISMWKVRGLPKAAKEWVADNFGTLVQSPYGDSFYDSDDISWDHKPDGSYRLADHWNFSSSYDGGIHCRTSTPVDNVKTWAVGRWNAGKGAYDIIKRWDAEGEYDPYPDLKNGYRRAHMVAPRVILPGASDIAKAVSKNYDFSEHRFASPVFYEFNRKTGELRLSDGDDGQAKDKSSAQ